jgi:hypothetical protein
MAKQNSDKRAVNKDQSFKARLQKSWDQVELEGKRILNSMGADLVNEDKSLGAVFSRIREHNPSLKKFAINLDSATYDVREKINWDAHMMSAYAKWQFDKALADVVKPRLDNCLSNVESKTNELVEKAQELTSRFSH